MIKIIVVSDIEIEVSRKRIKNMYLKVSGHDGRVRISAPLRTQDEAIVRFVSSKIHWIEKQKKKYEMTFKQNQFDYLDGETHYLWGEPYVLKIEKGPKNSIDILNNTLVISTNTHNSKEQREKLLVEWYRRQLKAKIPYMFSKWESIIGVKANAVTIRNMKSRWGSCNTRDKRISINLQLAKKPVICLEYVVVHELVHLIESSHNYVFKRYLDEFMPNWREIKKKLV